MVPPHPAEHAISQDHAIGEASIGVLVESYGFQVSGATVSPVGVVLITVNWLFAASLHFEYVAVQDLLVEQDASWQDYYDSGVMAFASFPVTLEVLLLVVPALVALIALVTRLARPTAVGWVALTAHMALQAWTRVGPAAPNSPSDYWVRLALLTACALAGIVGGANIRPVHHPRWLVRSSSNTASHAGSDMS